MLVNSINFDLSLITNDSVIISIIGYSTVFIALVFLFYIFAMIPKIINIRVRSRLKKEGQELPENENLHLSGDVSAAISMALHLYFNELHDKENIKLTLKKESKRYSPWSSKIYSVYNFKR